MSKVYVAEGSDKTLGESMDEKPLDPPTFSLTTPWLSLRNSSFFPLYFDFQQTQVNNYSVFVLLLYSTVLVYRAATVVKCYPNFLGFFNLFVSVLIVCVATFCCALRVFYNVPRFRKNVSVSMIAFLETVWLFGWNLYCSLTVLSAAMNGRCEDSHSYGCNMSGDRLDNDKMLVAMLISIFVYLVLRSAKWEVVLFSYIMSIVIITFCIFHYNLQGSVATFFSFLPFSSLALFEYRRQIMKLFEFNVQYTKIMEEAQAVELRHMIGNVAHDLKTPLSAFVCGVDCIKSLAEEIGIMMKNEIVDRVALTNKVASILENAVNVINTNSFMLMTINRCIDYTKASNNMKLTPRFETVNLQETISLPMHCMRDLQSDKIHIACLPLSSSIAPYIITDKQWLQENILCLLSNAVKYSSKGSVVLSVSLTYGMAISASQVMCQVDSDSKLCDDVHNNSLTPQRRVLRIEVEDTGIGLSEEVMANLFKPFKQAQRMAGGTGLGLFSLAKRMEALGGKYGVQKRRDGRQGSIFWFEIPYRPDESIVRSPQMSSDSHDFTPVGTVRSVPPLARVPSFEEVPSVHASTTASGGGPLTASNRVPKTISVVPKPHHHRASPKLMHGSVSASPVPISFSPATSLRVPAGSANASSAGPAAAAAAETAESEKEGKLSVLVVDDSPSILKMSSKMLERQGHHVTTAEDGAEGLERMLECYRSSGDGQQKRHLDVVLMDLQMPVMDGLEATARLRTFEKGLPSNRRLSRGSEGSVSSGSANGKGKDGRLLVIGVSANSDADTVKDAFAAGVDAFIPKPFNFKLFDEVYQGLLKQVEATEKTAAAGVQGEVV